MTDERCGIYYSSGDVSDIDTVANFLQQEGVSLEDPKTQKILALKDGDRHETDLAQIKQNLLDEGYASTIVWLKSLSDSIWSISFQNNVWIHEFTFYYIYSNDEVKKFSKIAFKLFAENVLSKNISLGMYIDLRGRTDDYDFDPFFVKNEGRIECFTDLICIPEEKLSRVDIDSVIDTVRWLDNGMVCASNDSAFLDYLLS